MLRKTLGKMLRALLSPRWVRIVRNPTLMPGYYRAFAREIEPIIDSMQANRDQDSEYWAAMLRKYVHIFDKGLNRPDFESGHSRQWYEAAKVSLDKLGNQHDSDPSVAWARKKILEYEHRQINPGPPVNSEAAFVSEEDYETLMRMIRGRRSARHFTNRPVETEILHFIVEALNWSPTSCNRQPAKVFVATDPEIVAQCAKTCAGATCFSGSGTCFISFCADMRPYNLPEEFLLPNLDIGLGIQNCLLVAHSLGISMTLLSWAQHTHEDDNKLRDLLHIPSHYRIIVNSLSGYPSLLGETPARKATESTVVYVQNTQKKMEDK